MPYCGREPKTSRSLWPDAALSKRIIKVGLCLVKDGALLLARSHGDPHFQIPGGKIQPGESDVDALIREIREELSVDLDSATARHLQTFHAAAAGRPDTMLELRLYAAEMAGTPRPSSEIAELHWQSVTGAVVECSSVVRDHVLPALAKAAF